MKKNQNAILSGLGFYRLSQARRKILIQVLLISLGLHVVGLAAFGWIKIMESLREETAVFTVPPPMKTYQPRQMEHKVKVQKQQRSSSRPQVRPRMVSTKPSALSLPDIPMDPKLVTTSFQPNFKSVSGMGMGVGMGTGHGLGGLGSGVAAFDFFGIRGRGTRVAIIVDVSLSMAEESPELGVTEKGIREFARVKERIGRVIDALPETAMFSVIVFAESGGTWKDTLQVATAQNKKDAKEYLKPFNSAINLKKLGYQAGFTRNPFGLKTAIGGSSRLDLALTKAFQQGADTLLIICDGLPLTRRSLTKAEEENYRARVAEAAENQRRETRRAEEPKQERVWIPPQPARPAIFKEGNVQPARPATEGRWVMRTQRQQPSGGGRIPPPAPTWSLEEYVQHVHLLHEELNEAKGQPIPTIHAIGYRIDRDGGRFMQHLAREFGGNYRRVTSIN